jgi:hypothetical protein
MKPTLQILIAVGVLILITFSASDCHTTDVQPTQVLIVPGEGIAGVRLGDSQSTVESILGKPDFGGIADGLYRAWFSAEYSSGEHSGLAVYFIEVDNRPGPVDLITVRAPYGGRSKEGIGIGSSLVSVHRSYGLPKRTYLSALDHWIADFYCFGSRHLEIHYKDSLVTTISTGYFLPMLQDTSYACR